MTDHAERPLTRRELRERERAQQSLSAERAEPPAQAERAERDEVAPAPAHPAPAHPAPAHPAPRTDADDYFERLAMASGDDAPTGMIVMPEVVTPDITGALSRSGDVMLTGSMRVSRDLSNFGAYREGLDEADDDLEVVTDHARGDHAPVRARDALSAHRTSGVSVAPSPERRIGAWIRVVVVAFAAAVVAGAALLLIGLTSGWF